MARVLHVHMVALDLPTGSTQMSVQTDIRVGIDGEDTVTTNLTPVINLKTLGIYKTAIQMNIAIMDAVKSYLCDEYSIPTNGYAQEYLSGGYNTLNIL